MVIGSIIIKSQANNYYLLLFGAIQVLRNAVGGGGRQIFPGKMHYNFISVTMFVKFPGKMRFVT